MFRVAVRVAVSVALGVAVAYATDQAIRLPDLPKLALERVPEAARVAVQQAYAAAEANARDAAANGRLAMLLHANGLLEEAEVCYRRARLLDGASFRWAYFLGLVQADRGNCDEGSANLRESVRLDSGYLPARLQLGECLLGSGQWEEAAKVYEAILAKHAGSAEAHYGLGRVRAIRKDLSGAVASLRKACDLAPDFGAAHYALAHTYQRLGKREESLQELALYEGNKRGAPAVADPMLDEVKALNADPLEKLRLGMELARQGKFEQAISADQEALEIDPRLVQAHVHLISLYGRLGRVAKAEEHYRAAVGLDANKPESYFNYGVLLAQQGKFPEAEAAFRRTAELNPAYPGARLNLGYTLEAQEKLPEALEQFKKAVETNPDDFQAHFDAGRILVNQEKYQDGIEHLQKSLGTDDERAKPAYLYALGAAYARSGDREKGLGYLKQARREAAAQGQSKLVDDIDADLRLLETERNSP